LKICIVTDAWAPQVNGVVTTMRNTRDGLLAMGFEVVIISPDQFRTIPCPGYPEIRLALFPYRQVARQLSELQPDIIHISTEAPLGMAARKFCVRHGLAFATSLHTRFPEYVRLRVPIPVSWTYRWLRRFHAPARHTLVRTERMKQELEQLGFEHMEVWPGAADTELFQIRGKAALDLPRPICMYMGRVAVEKGLPEFLDLDLPGSKVVVGGGPDLDDLQKRYPNTTFTGAKHGPELAEVLSAADVFVFPSRTDTFGLVMLEAMACGVPVAAFPVPGPLDLVQEGVTGALDTDLKVAIERALRLDGRACREYAEAHSWARSTERFMELQTIIPNVIPDFAKQTVQNPG